MKSDHGGARDGSGRPAKGPYTERLVLPLTPGQLQFIRDAAPSRATVDNKKPTAQDYVRWLIDISMPGGGAR